MTRRAQKNSEVLTLKTRRLATLPRWGSPRSLSPSVDWWATSYRDGARRRELIRGSLLRSTVHADQWQVDTGRTLTMSDWSGPVTGRAAVQSGRGLRAGGGSVAQRRSRRVAQTRATGFPIESRLLPRNPPKPCPGRVLPACLPACPPFPPYLPRPPAIARPLRPSPCPRERVTPDFYSPSDRYHRT